MSSGFGGSLAKLIALAVLVVGAVVVLVVVVFDAGGGGGSDSGSTPAGSSSGSGGDGTKGIRCTTGDPVPGVAGTQLAGDGIVNLAPVTAPASAEGRVFATCLDNQAQLVISATDLGNPGRVDVWLYNSRRDAKLIGAKDTAGFSTFLGRVALTRELPLRRYRYIDLSAEKLGYTGKRHSGKSLVRGRLT